MDRTLEMKRRQKATLISLYSTFKLTSIFAFAEDTRNTIQKDVDVYEIHEINVDSPFYKRIMKERVLLA